MPKVHTLNSHANLGDVATPHPHEDPFSGGLDRQDEEQYIIIIFSSIHGSASLIHSSLLGFGECFFVLNAIGSCHCFLHSESRLVAVQISLATRSAKKISLDVFSDVCVANAPEHIYISRTIKHNVCLNASQRSNHCLTKKSLTVALSYPS